ncbi:hypothetical protein [uncultured Chitinophaga sp.]|jgi:Terpene synthase family, metal binding domain.|uniref:terpene synthase family protein n=1 Tax=uncultured Chitinophaga sp. TaxID=339340 RepID=UPI00261CAFA1|nr:hypothetical protein [uncultured Chitinophaga sp.]
MQTVTIPLLYCPFSPAIHPQVKEVANHTDAWVASFNLYSGAAYRQYQDDNFAWLTARFYPEAQLEQLMTANDFIVLLFALRDLLTDRQAEICQSDFIAHFLAVTQDRGKPPDMDTTPLLAAWASLWPRLKQLGPAGWAAQFTPRLSALLQAAIPASVSKTSRLSTLAGYMETRPCLAGTSVSTGIIPVIENIRLPDEVLQHPALKELEQLSHKLLCWSDDLFSFGKERAKGNDYNLVSVLQQERMLTLDEALLCAAAIYNTDMRRFIMLSAQLPGFDEATDQAVARYVDALRRHIRGNIDWSEKDSMRHSFVYGRTW